MNSDSTVFTEDNCCAKTCQLFDCPVGFIANADNIASIDFSICECCVETCLA